MHVKQLKSGTNTYRDHAPLAPHPIEELQVCGHTGPLLEVPQLPVPWSWPPLLSPGMPARENKNIKVGAGVQVLGRERGLSLDKMTRGLP